MGIFKVTLSKCGIISLNTVLWLPSALGSLPFPITKVWCLLANVPVPISYYDCPEQHLRAIILPSSSTLSTLPSDRSLGINWAVPASNRASIPGHSLPDLQSALIHKYKSTNTQIQKYKNIVSLLSSCKYKSCRCTTLQTAACNFASAKEVCLQKSHWWLKSAVVFCRTRNWYPGRLQDIWFLSILVEAPFEVQPRSRFVHCYWKHCIVKRYICIRLLIGGFKCNITHIANAFHCVGVSYHRLSGGQHKV